MDVSEELKFLRKFKKKIRGRGLFGRWGSGGGVGLVGGGGGGSGWM